MATKKSSKNIIQSISPYKALVALSFMLNLAFIVLLSTVMTSSKLDMSLLNMVVSRDFDDKSCMKSEFVTASTSDPAGTKYCLQTIVVSPDNVITHPDSLKGRAYPLVK